MSEVYKDLTELYIGEGSFSKKPALSPKKASFSDLNALLQDSPEVLADDFIFQKKKVVFAFSQNRGKKWLRMVKDILLQNTAEVGRKLYPSLYLLSKGMSQNVKGRLFVRTKFASAFSYDDLQQIGRNILKRLVVLPQKFCSIDILVALNDDISVEIGRFLHPKTSGDGFYIHFSVNCRFSKVMKLLPLEYFNEKRIFRISEYGHFTSGRNGLLRIVFHLLEYGNKLIEWPELSENQTSYWQTQLAYQNRSSDECRRYLKMRKSNANESKGPYFMFVPGCIVKHSKFGYGVVIDGYEENQTDRVDVIFFKDGLKRTLVLKYASLQLISSSPSVFAYVSSEIRDRAESILEELDIPISDAIELFYKKIIEHRCVPL